MGRGRRRADIDPTLAACLAAGFEPMLALADDGSVIGSNLEARQLLAEAGQPGQLRELVAAGLDCRELLTALRSHTGCERRVRLRSGVQMQARLTPVAGAALLALRPCRSPGLEAVLAGLPLPWALLDATLTLRDCNDAYAEALRVPRPALLGRPSRPTRDRRLLREYPQV